MTLPTKKQIASYSNKKDKNYEYPGTIFRCREESAEAAYRACAKELRNVKKWIPRRRKSNAIRLYEWNKQIEKLIKQLDGEKVKR